MAHVAGAGTWFLGYDSPLDLGTSQSYTSVVWTCGGEPSNTVDTYPAARSGRQRSLRRAIDNSFRVSQFQPERGKQTNCLKPEDKPRI
jgi:hypothetical protein